MSSPEPYWYRANILYVVDGDTADMRIDLGFKTFRDERIRFMGINAAERGIEPGYSDAKAYVTALMMRLLKGTSRLYIKSYLDKHDVYGRYLANLYEHVLFLDTEIMGGMLAGTVQDEIDISVDMITKGLATPYMV